MIPRPQLGLARRPGIGGRALLGQGLPETSLVGEWHGSKTEGWEPTLFEWGNERMSRTGLQYTQAFVIHGIIHTNPYLWLIRSSVGTNPCRDTAPDPK